MPTRIIKYGSAFNQSVSAMWWNSNSNQPIIMHDSIIQSNSHKAETGLIYGNKMDWMVNSEASQSHKFMLDQWLTTPRDKWGDVVSTLATTASNCSVVKGTQKDSITRRNSPLVTLWLCSTSYVMNAWKRREWRIFLLIMFH